jgi:hypothetical protein
VQAYLDEAMDPKHFLDPIKSIFIGGLLGGLVGDFVGFAFPGLDLAPTYIGGMPASNLPPALRSDIIGDPGPGPVSNPVVENVPNPNGRNGGPAHQKGMAQAEDYINTQTSYTGVREYPVKLYGSVEGKSVRYVDVAALDVNGDPVMFFQVGNMTQGGYPVAREMRALIDITELSVHTGVTTIFIPK